MTSKMEFEEYKINNEPNIRFLRNGVSGLMRVKNEAEFIALSIDSCIDALDELIIVFQKSEDKTEEEIRKKQRQYPDKIKVYFYEPTINSHNLSDEEFEELSKLPNDSVHLLSNYYNYTLSKASYKYALKIDADQIYNKYKLKVICDAYRSESKEKIAIRENISYVMVKFIGMFCFHLVNRVGINFQPQIPSSILKLYYSCALKKIKNKKIISSFMGINLYIKDNTPFLPLGNYKNKTFPPFNGIDDHILFTISSDTYYLPSPQKSRHAMYKNCIIESFSMDKYMYKPLGYGRNFVNMGFLWIHVAPLKKNIYLSTKDLYSDKLLQPINHNDTKNLKKTLSDPIFYRQKFWFNQFWKNWRKQTDLALTGWELIIKKIVKDDNTNVDL